MNTTIVPGTAIGGLDERVKKALARETFDAGMRCFLIGIRNESGDIYRRIEANTTEIVAMEVALARIGLTNEIGPDEPRRGGLDAIFSLRT